MPLNPSYLDHRQQAAVTDTEGPVAIIACPGAGKTACLAARVARLLDSGEGQAGILCLTFTNRAAEEMRSRIQSYASLDTDGMWIGTIHSVCGRLLRAYGPSPDFSICDEKESKQIVRELVKAGSYGVRSPLEAAEHISRFKRSTMELDDWCNNMYKNMGYTYAAGFRSVYQAYQNELKVRNALDFDDLILHVYHLFQNEPSVLAAASSCFQYISIDEYQDTSLLETKVIQSLSSVHDNLCVIGDPNQSIYGWRGSVHQLISQFPKNYTGTTVHNLTTNYRSARSIVTAAGNLISRNTPLISTPTRPARGDNGHIIHSRYMDDEKEAEAIVQEIRKLVPDGRNYSDIAILYRIHAAADSLISALRSQAVPITLIREDLPDQEVIDAENGVAEQPDEDNAVRLMTIHQSKGMEFPVVFLIGLEEEVLPHWRSLSNTEHLEEERRLCYVAISRAVDRLYLSSCRSRILHRKSLNLTPSRFVDEMRGR